MATFFVTPSWLLYLKSNLSPILSLSSFLYFSPQHLSKNYTFYFFILSVCPSLEYKFHEDKNFILFTAVSSIPKYHPSQ